MGDGLNRPVTLAGQDVYNWTTLVTDKGLQSGKVVAKWDEKKSNCLPAWSLGWRQQLTYLGIARREWRRHASDGLTQHCTSQASRKVEAHIISWRSDIGLKGLDIQTGRVRHQGPVPLGKPPNIADVPLHNVATIGASSYHQSVRDVVHMET